MKIYYDGVGANASSVHTVKEFLGIMNKHYNIECSDYIVSQNADKSEDCRQARNMYKEEFEYFDKHKRKMKTSKKRNSIYEKHRKRCKKYKKTIRKRCDLDEYIYFSGAEKKR